MASRNIPHPPGTKVRAVEVAGETIYVPANHDGSRIKVELPDGSYAYTDGWDPAERAAVGERPIVPCGTCGSPQTLVASEFDCSACGARNQVNLVVNGDAATASDDRG